MSGLQKIKARIKSVDSTRKLTSAMKLMSSAKLRQNSNLLSYAGNYVKTLNKMFFEIFFQIGFNYLEKEKFFEKINENEKFLFQNEKNNLVVILIIGAKKGLCGGYNLSIIKKTVLLAKKIREEEKKEIIFIPIGEKVVEYFKKNYANETVLFNEFLEKKYKNQIDKINEIFEKTIEFYKKNEATKLIVVHGKFKNALIQESSFKNILPFKFEELKFEELFQEIFEKKGKNIEKLKKIEQSTEIVFDEKIFEILPIIIKKKIQTEIYLNFVESESCEEAARMRTMENATKNADEIIKKLKLQYNRTRQAQITNELIEVISGANSLKV